MRKILLALLLLGLFRPAFARVLNHELLGAVRRLRGLRRLLDHQCERLQRHQRERGAPRFGRSRR